MKNYITNLAEITVIRNRINEFQESPWFHPLTCGLCRENLVPVIVTLHQEKDRHQLVLKCPHDNCKYEQFSIPEFLLHDDH